MDISDKLQGICGTLMRELSLQEDNVAASARASVLETNILNFPMSSKLIAHQVKKMESNSSDPKTFRRLYDEIKSENETSPVDNMLSLVSRIMDDKALSALLGVIPNNNGSKTMSLDRSFDIPSTNDRGLVTPSTTSYGSRFEETTPVSKSAMNQTLPTPIYHKPSPSLSEINTANRPPLSLLPSPSTSTLNNTIESIQLGGIKKNNQFGDLNESITNAINLSSSSSRVDNVPRNTLSNNKTNEANNPLIIYYGMNIQLRSSSAFCLSVIPQPNNVSRLSPFNVSLQGCGVGEATETFKLINTNFREDKSPVKYGDQIALISTFSGGKYLANDSTTDKVLLKRTQFGANEKWTILCMGEKENSESKGGRGSPTSRIVQSCDSIVLRSASGKYLSSASSSDNDAVKVIKYNNGNIQNASLSSLKNECWNIIKCHTPFTPSWLREGRSCLVNTLFAKQEKDLEDLISSKLKMNVNNSPLSLHSFPIPIQECMLIEDLLYSLFGIEGKYIRLKSDPHGKSTFFIDSATMDSSLAELVTRILPVCGDYLFISSFIERYNRYEYGMTSHAFSAAVKDLMREYNILIAQLETQSREGKLTLGKMWFYIQPSIHTCDLLSKCCREAEGKIGGELLNALYNVSLTGGDSKSEALMTFILNKASAPFFHMLSQWIYQGAINDPYSEFVIAQRKDLGKENLKEDFNASYWDERYTIREKHLPIFLSSLGDMILSTGKYLNVVRECGRSIKTPFVEVIEYTHRRRTFNDKLEKAYKFASNLLLDLLMGEEDLINRLQTLKQFFLLEFGDFFVHLCDVADEELVKDASQIDVIRLESFLTQAIHSSVSGENKYSKDISCVLERYTLIEHLEAIHNAAEDNNKSDKFSYPTIPQFDSKNKSNLKGFEAFTLSYQVKWPLSLVISRQALIKYQLLFRHIFCCKHVERQLSLTWLDHQLMKECDLRVAMGSTFTLRHRMQHFLRNLVYYLLIEVLEPHWCHLNVKLGEVTTVDQVLSVHNEFLDTCLKECLLTHRELLKILTKIMSTCMLFSKAIQSFMDSIYIDEETMLRASKLVNQGPSLNSRGKPVDKSESRRQRIAVQSNHIRNAVSQQAYISMISNFKNNFDENLNLFMSQLLDKSHLQFHSHLSNLCQRLDYNGFYTNYLRLEGGEEIRL